jgi:ketosteroid isomerase-like protein
MTTDEKADRADVDGIESVTRAWEQAFVNRDVEALVALYAADATLESPAVAHILGGRGVCRGHDQLRPFIAEVVARTPDERHFHRAGLFTDGHRVTWEYPRQTPDGEQMDFVEVMEIEDGLIHAHRVYWGWRGVEVLTNDEYR